MVRLLKDILAYPYPLRVALFRGLRRLRNKFSRSHYYYRTVFNEVERPEYGYCIYKAAMLAKSLGYPGISVLEFGIARAEGLLNIENHIEKHQAGDRPQIRRLRGFGLEEGLPAPQDYRDLPFKWWQGRFNADTGAIEKKLKISKLVLGDVKETCGTFFENYDAPPVGAALFDLDYYSSTRDAFQVFGDSKNYLPRVYCNFDDILGTNELHRELRAIKEFNEANPAKKFAKPLRPVRRTAGGVEREDIYFP